MNKIIILAFLTITTIGCQEAPNNSVIQEKIDEQLKSGKNVDMFFLDLKFGMHKTEFNNYIVNQYSTGKLKKAYSGYSYEFINNNDLNGINWIISPALHNDSLIGITLYSFKDFWEHNYNTLNHTYNEIINEYQNKYGTPNYTVGKFIKYWFLNNLEINITKSNGEVLGGTVRISYKNTRKRREINYTKCRFDKDGNSFDNLYYEKMKKEQINEDI